MVRDLAAAQHGVVARRQLVEAGLTARKIDGQVARGELVLLHRGVYALGHRQLRREGFWLAAVLAAGSRAVLSHREAAALHAIRQSNRARIDVTAPGRRRSQAGIELHHAPTLHSDDITVVEGIPVTTVARTLIDLATVVAPNQLAKAINEAERLRLFDLRAVEEARERVRHRNGPGHARLAAALAEQRALATTLTRSVLEDAFLAAIRTAGIPIPRTNAPLHGYEVDALWPAERLVVELDGYAYHRSPRAFQHDRTKSNVLATAGYTVLRFTHDDVTRRPAATAAIVRGRLDSTTPEPAGPCPPAKPASRRAPARAHRAPG